jgi:beta-lactamase class A
MPLINPDRKVNVTMLKKYISILIILSSIIACGQKKGNQVEEFNIVELEDQINSYIKTKIELIAVSLELTRPNRYLGINDEISVHAASTMKVPVMAEVFRQADRGIFSLDDSLLIKNEFASIIDGSTFSLDITEDGGDRLYSMIGQKESIRSLVNEMITYSGNLATNLLIEKVGAGNTQQFMKTLGANDIQVLRGVEDIKAYRAGKNNTTTAKDLAIILKALLLKKKWREASSNEMITILLDQKFKKKIPAGLPANVKVAHKTGSITKIDHDAGIIFPPDRPPYILVVLTKGFENHEEAQHCIAEISRMVYQWYMGEGGENLE